MQSYHADIKEAVYKMTEVSTIDYSDHVSMEAELVESTFKAHICSSLGCSSVCRRLGEPRPELDIDLNPTRPGDRRQEASQLVDGSGPVRICR